MVPVVFAAGALLLGAGLGYFIFIGVRAIYRSTSQIARDAGYPHASAGRRAALRMAVWAAFFGLFYAFLYFVGRRIGWWALVPGMLGAAAVIFSLLQADRLLTIRRGAVREQLSIVLTIVAVIAGLASITWFAASAG